MLCRLVSGYVAVGSRPMAHPRKSPGRSAVHAMPRSSMLTAHRPPVCPRLRARRRTGRRADGRSPPTRVRTGVLLYDGLCQFHGPHLSPVHSLTCRRPSNERRFFGKSPDRAISFPAFVGRHDPCEGHQQCESVMFGSVLLTVNLCLLGLAGLFLGGQRPGGSEGQVLAFACVLAQVLTIKTLVRSKRERRQRARSGRHFRESLYRHS